MKSWLIPPIENLDGILKTNNYQDLKLSKKELSLCGADYIQLLTQEDIISPLINFFFKIERSDS